TDGWRAALRDAGVGEPEVITGDWSARSGYETGKKLARMADVTAVFCSNDTIALGLIRALTEAGRRVPEDVSVVGFDDMPEAGYFLPPLTTVRQDFAELGRRALGTLIERISGAAPGQHLPGHPGGGPPGFVAGPGAPAPAGRVPRRAAP